MGQTHRSSTGGQAGSPTPSWVSLLFIVCVFLFVEVKGSTWLPGIQLRLWVSPFTK